MSITNCTLPDIEYAINKLSRFTSNPGNDHWKASTNFFKYLRYTVNYGLQDSRYPTVLEGYTAINWIFDTRDSKSTCYFYHWR